MKLQAEAKYKPGDVVWAMIDNSPTEVRISVVEIRISGEALTRNQENTYRVLPASPMSQWTPEQLKWEKLNEFRFFQSREQLIESLK